MRTAESFLNRCNMLMSGQSPKAILAKAINIIEDPSRWTATAQALDVNGRRVKPCDPSAVCWSIESAIAKACNDYGIVPPYFMVLLDGLLEEQGFVGHVPYFEQYHDHQAMLWLLHLAHERATV